MDQEQQKECEKDIYKEKKGKKSERTCKKRSVSAAFLSIRDVIVGVYLGPQISALCVCVFWDLQPHCGLNKPHCVTGI